LRPEERKKGGMTFVLSPFLRKKEGKTLSKEHLRPDPAPASKETKTQVGQTTSSRKFAGKGREGRSHTCAISPSKRKEKGIPNLFNLRRGDQTGRPNSPPHTSSRLRRGPFVRESNLTGEKRKERDEVGLVPSRREGEGEKKTEDYYNR